jgi:hypothetical protein
MAKWHDRRSESVKSYSKAYGTTCRRQKQLSTLQTLVYTIQRPRSDLGCYNNQMITKFCVVFWSHCGNVVISFLG